MQSSSPPSIIFRHRSLLLTLAVMLLLPLLSACRDKTPVMISRFQAFGTPVDVSLVGVTQDEARQASALVAEDFALLEHAWAASEDGLMRRVNRLLPTGELFVAPPAVLPLIRLAKDFERQSGGLINPATGKLMGLWDFDQSSLAGHRPPPATWIRRLVQEAPSMAQIDIEGLELRGRNPALKLDFSGIARSHAIDLAIEHLQSLGVRNAMIQAGSELRAIGDRSGQPWRCPILRPSGSGVFAILSIWGDESLVTRAEYDRNFIFEGTLYHDILDPRTGWPANETRAVTVVAEQAALAAAAASALFVAGPSAWEAIARQMGIRYALLVDRQGRIHMTAAMAERIDLVDEDEEISVAQPSVAAPEPSGARI